MTAKEQAKKPGWYGLATGVIGLSVAVVGYLDTQAKAKQAESLRVEADTAIIEKLTERVEDLEDEVVELRINQARFESIGVPANGGVMGPFSEPFPVDPGEEVEAAEAEVPKLLPPRELFGTQEKTRKKGKRDKASREKDTVELKELIQQRAY